MLIKSSMTPSFTLLSWLVKEVVAAYVYLDVGKHILGRKGGSFSGSITHMHGSTTSDVLELKWRASLKLHYCSMIDFNF